MYVFEVQVIEVLELLLQMSEEQVLKVTEVQVLEVLLLYKKSRFCSLCPSTKP